MPVAPSMLRERFAAHWDGTREADVEAIAAVLEPCEESAGTQLLSHGQDSDRLYLVVEGQVDIRLPCGAVVLDLASRGPGSWVGELGLIEPGPASADVVVRQDATFWTLDHAAWRAFRRARPSAAAALTRVLCQDLAARLRATDVLGFEPSRGDGSVARATPVRDLAAHPFVDVLRRLFGHRGAS